MARVAACDGFTPRKARKKDELTTLRDDLAATRECTKPSHELDAAAAVIAALHHDFEVVDGGGGTLVTA